MKKKIKPIVAGLCLGGLLLTGCVKEEGNNKTTTEEKESTDIVTTEDGEEVESVDAPLGMIESCELTQLEDREIISVSVVGDGETLYVSTCFEDTELAMSVYEVLRFDYQEPLKGYGEPVVMQWDDDISCIYFTTNQAGTKAYLSVLSENPDIEDSEESFFLRLAVADIEENQLKNITLLEGMEETGNQIISAVDEEENIYYVAEDMETGTLVAKAAYAGEGYIAQELFGEGHVQTAILEEETEEAGEQEVMGESGSENQTDMNQEGEAEAENLEEDADTRKENTVLWEEIINIRSIVKAEDGVYYFTAPRPKDGVYVIYSTKEQEDGLFAYPELLPKEINDGVEDKLYCAVSTSEKYLYYISSKSTVNEDGEFYSKTMLYRVLRENLEETIEEQ
ncbi:MAG: hypothetical protein IJA10_08790 [Lachnospiraceae bacterium]|nr:hypothetical protein [Lachnospiraceae bacterium]